jgi:hypothetical protein
MKRIAIAATLALLPSLALAQAVTPADRSGTITVGGAAQVLMPGNPSRHGCIVQNNSAGDIWISDVGTAALAEPAFKVPTMTNWECKGPPSGAISIIGATTAQTFSAREW